MLLGHDTDERSATRRLLLPPPQAHPAVAFEGDAVDCAIRRCWTGVRLRPGVLPPSAALPSSPSPSSFKLSSSLAASCCTARIVSRHPSSRHWNRLVTHFVAAGLMRRRCEGGASVSGKDEQRLMDEGAATNSVPRPPAPSPSRTALIFLRLLTSSLNQEAAADKSLAVVQPHGMPLRSPATCMTLRPSSHGR
jgi:hypothetical protein